MITGRRVLRGPAEGWLSIGLVVALCVTMAWAIDDVALVLGRPDFTDFLVPMAIAGALLGVAGAKAGWGRWRTYLVGSVFAALVVPLEVGGILVPGAGPAESFRATATSTVTAATDLIVRNLQFTTEYGHYLWVLGLLVWATAMFAGYATFGRHRPLNAIVVVGFVMLVNMALTVNDQLPYLVLFSIASLLLLVRSHVIDEQAEWVRRRIGDPASVSSVYLRGGTVFVVAAVVGSLLLTDVARSTPLGNAWTGLSSTVVEFSRSIQKFLPAGGNSRSFGADFDPTGTTIRGIWSPGSQLELTISLPPTETRPFYWRAVSWNEFTGNAWRVSDPVASEVAAGDPLLKESADAGSGDLSETLTFTVDPGHQTSTLFSPLTPATVDQPVAMTMIGADRRFGEIQLQGDGPYTVTALLHRSGDLPGELSQEALRSAGTDYPADIRALYLGVPDDAIPKGGVAEALLAKLTASAEAKFGTLDPFDLASFLQDTFRSSGPDALFHYDPNVLDLVSGPCKDLSTVECFATFKRGYCQYYATTMAVFLRAKGIPARIVEGFLPGPRQNGVERIYNSQSHEWVEVYFPGYGWYTFDPTGGGLARTEPLPTGRPGPSTTPQPTLSFGPVTTDREGADRSATPGAGPVGGGGDSTGPLIAISIVLAILVGGLAFLAWQRGPRGGTTPERAYRSLTRLAGRFGFGPRPDQTVYEYATTLGEVLPMVRPELQTVATAKVETAYGRGLLSGDRLRSLRAADRRLRLNLLRLAFRRAGRRWRR